MTIEASDQRSPPKTMNATLTVDIQKNALPTFTNMPGTITVLENTPVNQLVYQVIATDSDLSVGVPLNLVKFKINILVGYTKKIFITLESLLLSFK